MKVEKEFFSSTSIVLESRGMCMSVYECVCAKGPEGSTFDFFVQKYFLNHYRTIIYLKLPKPFRTFQNMKEISSHQGVMLSYVECYEKCSFDQNLCKIHRSILRILPNIYDCFFFRKQFSIYIPQQNLGEPQNQQIIHGQ